MLILGYDPGGKGKNGLSLVHVSEENGTRAWLHTCDCVNHALIWVKAKMQEIELTDLDAAGIDTYLSWSAEPCGWRSMDIFLKTQYPAVGNSVFASNSAFGSMAVQGMAMALRLRCLWPNIRLNETHPKVLYYAISRSIYSFKEDMKLWLLNRFDPPLDTLIYNEHQWDALFSAWITWTGLQGLSGKDLMETRKDNLLLPAGNVSYYWI